MDAGTAAAIGSICACILGVVTIAGQVILAMQHGKLSTAVNGQSHALNQLTAVSSHAEGVLEGKHLDPGMRSLAELNAPHAPKVVA